MRDSGGPSHQREQKERREVLRQDQLRPGDSEPTTFSALAGLDTSLGGRFAPGGYVGGSERTTDYPRLPEGSPWAGDPVGLEPSLGYSVDDLEPTGTAAEVERSLVLAALVGGEKAEVAPALAASSPVGVVETPRPPPSTRVRRRRI